ncbi:hypothetical protein, partial [Enterococcus faecium]|uniref:hypothetical protein n=1 Tax=Enterococcus faecium TaxID=1352 RepID=UPI003D9FBCC1
RLEPENCKVIHWDKCKDANECFVSFGLPEFKAQIANCRDIKISGVINLYDIQDDIIELWEKGLQRGVGIGYNNFDDTCT